MAATAVWMAGTAAIVDLDMPHAGAAVVRVTNCGDSGPGSLRSAVANAPQGATIRIVCRMITLSSAVAISNSITILGRDLGASAVSGNDADRVFQVSSGAAVGLIHMTIENGHTSTDGGGIVNNGTLTITNSTVANNTAGFGSLSSSGGGIDNAGNLTITKTTVSGNFAGGDHGDFGGGISNSGTLTITNSTVSGNSGGGMLGGFGGGISNSGTLTMTNSTVSGNDVGSSATQGGGIFNGGGRSPSGTVTISNSTVSGNGAEGIFGGATVGTTVLAGNANGNCSVPLTDVGYNIADDSSCGFVSSTSRTFPGLGNDLGPLANHGGSTQTVALLPGNPAIDQVSPPNDCPPTDQRGASRTTPCDIGAFDTDGWAITSPDHATAFAGSPFVFTITTTGSPPPRIKKMGALPQGIHFRPNRDGTATLSGTPPRTTPPGPRTLSFVALFGAGKGKVVVTQVFTLAVAGPA